MLQALYEELSEAMTPKEREWRKLVRGLARVVFEPQRGKKIMGFRRIFNIDRAGKTLGTIDVHYGVRDARRVIYYVVDFEESGLGESEFWVKDYGTKERALQAAKKWAKRTVEGASR